MESPNAQQICQSLDEYVTFFRAFGDVHGCIPRFQEFSQRFRDGKASKALLRELVDFRDSVHNQVLMQLLNHRCLPGKNDDETHDEYYRVVNSLGAALHPPKPKPLEMDISSFKGADRVEQKITRYAGNPNGVREIVERSLDLVQQYASAISRSDFDSAYKLTGAGLQDWMSFKKFVGEHERAAREFGGPALEFHVDGFLFIFADDGARQKSTSEEGWPKTTTKESRRSRLNGFWIRDRAAQTGCWGAFHVTEENKEYRVAKFEFFAQ